MKPVIKGILWILGPWITLFLVLVIWSVTAFTFSTMVTSGDATAMVSTARIVNMVLGFVGIISVLMIPIGLIVGVVIMVGRKTEQPLQAPEPPKPPEVGPPQV